MSNEQTKVYIIVGVVLPLVLCVVVGIGIYILKCRQSSNTTTNTEPVQVDNIIMEEVRSSNNYQGLYQEINENEAVDVETANRDNVVYDDIEDDQYIEPSGSHVEVI